MNNNYLCPILTPILSFAHAEQGRWSGDDMMEKRLLDALSLTTWNFATFETWLKNKAMVDACVVCL